MPQYADWTTRVNCIPIVNTTNETIPAGGVVATVGDPDEFGRKRVGKPTSNGQLGCYIVGPQPILPSDSEDGEPVGWATFDTPALAAYDPADGDPAVGETWGPGVNSWLLRKNKGGFLIDGPFDELDGRVVVLRVGGEGEDDYPYPYGSYDGDGNGSSVSHEAILNIHCDDGEDGETDTGNILGDKVRYTTVGLVRRGRLTLSISMEVVEEDFIVVETECKEFLTKDSTVTCVDGVITFTKVTEKVKVIVCGSCP